MSGRIAELWRSYREQVVPAGASPAQLQGTELAFYGGASALFALINDVLEPGAEPTERDLQVMTEISEELRAHVRTVNAEEPSKPTEVYVRPGEPGSGSSFELRAWGPTPDGSGQPTQIHMLLAMALPPPIGNFAAIVRLKSAEGTDRLLKDLQRLRREVWP